MQELTIEHLMRGANSAVNLDAGSDNAILAQEFEERLAECGKLAFRVARGVLRNSADAEDVAQEAFLKAYRNFPKLRNRERFRSWLVRITWRLALDRSRSGKRREVRELAWSAEQPKPSVESMAASSEFGEQLDKALTELPEKLRIVLVLTAIEGHTLEDVARLLGLPVGTVKSRMHFGRKQLAEKLQWLVNDTKKT
jgi:RNA polymerase sigma-70 factor (ECF subfamily)